MNNAQNNNQFIYIAEMTCDNNETSITPKWKDMKYIEKIISRVLKDTIEQNLKEKLQSLSQTLEQQERVIKKLEGNISSLENQLTSSKDRINALSNSFNSQKANADTNYKRGIDKLGELNSKFIQYVPIFGRNGHLQLLQELVTLLHTPTETILEELSGYAKKNKDNVIQSIMDEIVKFNKEYRLGIEKYLSEVANKKWEECVIFPQGTTYDSKTMGSYNEDLTDGVQVYIVSLGFNFPNSNVSKQLPLAIAKQTIASL